MDKAEFLAAARNTRGIGSKTMERLKEQLQDDDYVSEYNPDLHLDENTINHGDCLDLMNGIPDNSVYMILADLPYGTTQCSWDSIVSLDKLWTQYKRILKDKGVIVLTSSGKFTPKLKMSNIDWYKYCWVWDKKFAANFGTAKYKPMKVHEDICIFSEDTHSYYPQMIKRENPIRIGSNSSNSSNRGMLNQNKLNNPEYDNKVYDDKYPESIIKFSIRDNYENKFHPTQKPVKLFEYLIKTYTNKGDLVLDNTSGAGTTAIASLITNRSYICIEKEKEYYDKSVMWVSLIKQGINYKEAMKQVKNKFQ